jgi:hypothetical protein
MSYLEAKKGAVKWVNALRKKGKHIMETEQDVKTEIDFKNGVKLVQLVGKSAFEREGFAMSHCVASYYNKDNTKVFSLRDAKNNPHCTIEVKGDDTVQQIKGKGNGSIHPKYIKYILKTLKHFGMEVRDSEMQNLGYVNLDSITDGLNAYIEKHFDNVKYIMFNGTKYFYEHSKLEPKQV